MTNRPGGSINRRTGLHLAAAACLAGHLPAVAQVAGRTPRIGVLRWGTPDDEARANLTDALAAIGYRESQTVHIEWRWASTVELAQRHAAELAGMDLDLVVGSATPAVQALRAATRRMPIVMATAADPVGSGLVASLARPGGNVTGVSANLTTMVPKQLQLLTELLPGLQRVAFLGSTDDPATRIFVDQSQTAARLLHLRMQVVLVSQAHEFESATSSMARERTQAVVVQPLFTLGRADVLPPLLRQRKLASISALRQFVAAGGLATYGPSRADQWRRAAAFVDRILRGAKPATLPVEEPTLFDLALNLTTAKALGLAVPQSLLLRAGEVIQ